MYHICKDIRASELGNVVPVWSTKPGGGRNSSSLQDYMRLEHSIQAQETYMKPLGSLENFTKTYRSLQESTGVSINTPVCYFAATPLLHHSQSFTTKPTNCSFNASSVSKLNQYLNLFPRLVLKAQRLMKSKVVRVSPRQCNTGDTVGGKMSKLSANHPSFKNRYNLRMCP